MPIRRIAVWFLLAILLIWNVDKIVKIPDSGQVPLWDFSEYWSACRVFLSGGNAYDPAQLLREQRNIGWTDKDPIMMWNPPWTLPVLLPLAIFNYWPSRGLWFLLSIILIWTASDWFWRIYGGSLTRRWISWLAPLFFLPSLSVLLVGQITPLVLSGVAGFLWALERKKYFLAGAFTLLIAIKPHLLFLFWVFLALWILKQRCWKVLTGVFSALICASLSATLINPHVFSDYWNSVLSRSGPQYWETPNWGVAIAFVYPHLGEWVRYIPSFVGIIIALYLWHSWTFALDWKQKMPTILLLSVTTSSFAWSFDSVILLPVVVLVLCCFEINPFKGRWLLVALAVMQPLLVLSLFITRSNFYTIWLPPALWLLFWKGTRLRSSLETGASVNS